MNALFAAAAEIQSFLRRADERFCFIGGTALQRWGEPRLTREIGLTLLCPFGAEEKAADRLLGGFAPRIPQAREFAIQNRVVLLSGNAGVPVDVALGAFRLRSAVYPGQASSISAKFTSSHAPRKSSLCSRRSLLRSGNDRSGNRP